MNFVQSSCSIWLRIRRGILYTYDELATAEESEWIPASRCYQLEPPQHFLSLPPILPITSFPTYHLATMSRRPDPARAAQNQQTIKNLLKLESNKTCADCKRNKRTDHDSLSATFLLRLHHIARFSATILIVSFQIHDGPHGISASSSASAAQASTEGWAPISAESNPLTSTHGRTNNCRVF